MLKRCGALICTLISYTVGAAYALVVEVPPSQGYEDIITGPTTRISSNADTIMGFIQLINQYLWFSIGFVAFVVLLYGGYKLMLAQGSEKEVEAANKMMLNGGIGLFIAILSYAGIRVIVNLF